uniref:Uncharacterized protein n=1 Tax=Cannabis sativa TaxID=3483 RepID=A0A803Q2I6_CANSA
MRGLFPNMTKHLKMAKLRMYEEPLLLFLNRMTIHELEQTRSIAFKGKRVSCKETRPFVVGRVTSVQELFNVRFDTEQKRGRRRLNTCGFAINIRTGWRSEGIAGVNAEGQGWLGRLRAVLLGGLGESNFLGSRLRRSRSHGDRKIWAWSWVSQCGNGLETSVKTQRWYSKLCSAAWKRERERRV